MRRNATLIVIACCSLSPLFGAMCVAQETSPETQSESKNDQVDLIARPNLTTQPDVTLSIVPGGMKRSVPGRWGTMAVNGVNRSDRDAEKTVIVQFGDDSDTQFARRMWIPAHSRRQAWLPVLLPKVDATLHPQLKMKSIQLKDSAAGEEYQSNVVGSPISERSLMLSREEARSAVALSVTDRTMDGQERIYGLLNAIYVCRDASTNSIQDLGVINYSAPFLPPGPKSLDSIDHLIVGSEEFLNDTIMASRVRQWVQDGGRLWILLDQFGESASRKLLGELTCFAEVDRVALNEFQLDYFEDADSIDKPTVTSSRSADDPFQMVRVLTDDVTINCTVDGWPAAFWQQVGQGEILYTTVDVRGLVDERKPLPAFESVVSQFFSPRMKSPRHSAVMTSMTDKEIGYQIPRRSLIAMILGAHVLLLLVAGAFLAKQKRLHLLAALVPLTALTATGFLLWLGNRNTTSITPTIASGQFARVMAGGSELQLDATTAIYSPEVKGLDLKAAPGATMTFAKGDADQENKRLLWTDDGKSQWVNMRQPPGVVRHINSQSTIRLSKQWSANGQFGPDGFAVQMQGLDPSKCQDLIVASESTPTLALKRTDRTAENIRFLGSPTDILGEDQFVSGKLISDRQRQRQSVLRQLILPKKGQFGQEPTVFLWTDPINSELQIGDAFLRRGDALVSMPITYQRLDPESQFTVPPNFVRLELNAGRRGFSPLYNPRTGQWLQDITKPQTVELDCFIPPSLLPCKLSKATIEIKLNAPSRTLQLKGKQGDEDVVLYEQENPNGLIRVDVDRPEWLQLNDSGAMRLVVSISKTEQELIDEQKESATPATTELHANDNLANQPTERRTWQIDFLRVGVVGKTE